MAKSRRKVKLETMLRLTGIQNISQKLTSTLLRRLQRYRVGEFGTVLNMLHLF